MEGTRKRKAVHDDDTTPNTETKKLASRRKRQGVTKTNSAAVKAIIRQNQANSPLLRLAPEIREKILTYLVGDQVLHLSLSRADLPSLDTNSGRQNEKSLCIVYLICQANTLEANDYHQAHRHKDDDSAESSGEYYVESRKQHHRYCEHAITVKENRRNRHLNLNIIGASRQCYEEANHLLWSTNTFTFDDSYTFELFLNNLNPAQKRQVKSLSFFECINRWNFFKECWPSAFRPTNLRMLQGLQKLTLSFDLHQSWSQVYGGYDHVESEFMDKMESFLRFRMIPLNEVSVSISDSPRLKKADRRLDTRLTAAQKYKLARECAVKLLDPDPAATIEAEEDAKELAACTHIEGYYRDRNSFYDRALENAEAQAEAAADRLEQARGQSATSSTSRKVLAELQKLEKEADNTRKSLCKQTRRTEKQKVEASCCMKEAALKRQVKRRARKRLLEACKPTPAA